MNVFTEPTYQNPPGTLYYPSNSQDSRQSIVYPAYAPNMNIPMIPSYHQELTQQQAQSQALSSEQVKFVREIYIYIFYLFKICFCFNCSVGIKINLFFFSHKNSHNNNRLRHNHRRNINRNRINSLHLNRRMQHMIRENRCKGKLVFVHCSFSFSIRKCIFIFRIRWISVLHNIHNHKKYNSSQAMAVHHLRISHMHSKFHWKSLTSADIIWRSSNHHPCNNRLT